MHLVYVVLAAVLSGALLVAVGVAWLRKKLAPLQKSGDVGKML